MMFSIIIPTFNRPRLLQNCLSLLTPEHQQFPNSLYEIIVSDDSDRLETRQMLAEHFPKVKWVQGGKRGPAANRNKGARQAKGKWLLFIDDDCLPSSVLLRRYQHAIENTKGSVAFEGAILPDDWNLLKLDMAECPVNTKGNCCWSANICIENKTFWSVGGFDVCYLIAAQEDQQLKLDLEAATKKPFIFVQDGVVVHPVRFVSLVKKLKMLPSQSRNFCLYAEKNKQVLGYITIFSFTRSQIIFHTRRTWQSFRAAKWKSSLLSLVWLFVGVPLNIFNLMLCRWQFFQRK